MKRLSPEALDRGEHEFGPQAPVGIVHLGIGAFHRAHQAVYTQLAAAPGEWGICGVTQRSATVAEQLRPQQGLYSVLERGPQGVRLDVIDVVRDVVDGSSEPERLTERLAQEQVQVVTLTITEKGYRPGPGGALDRLITGLAARRAAGGAPLTVLSCDNLNGNGEVLRDLVLEHSPAPLAAWVADHVRFPCSMVDRIVPATTAADRAEAAERLGLLDEALVVAEPFRQWVIQDDFAAARPAWEKAGAELVADVAPYERRKLRVLNGAHSLLAYLGALAGHTTIAQAASDDALAAAAWRLIEEDVAPTLAPDGLEVLEYGRTVLQRFGNPALPHRTVQVAMDGSLKLGPRLLGTIRDARAAGRLPQAAILGVAAWMAYVEATTHSTGLPLDDPHADVLSSAVTAAPDSAAGLVEALLGVDEVFAPDLRDDGELRAALVEQVQVARSWRRKG
ncbi:mannitol dehydrogenase [Kineosporia sp. NBRC 101677]|uniref:mannitol dehydrogenase family protein n=1 Tax=Kineosporia sp. NBRC 101677 TaxID=3032197 RepID=UPI0024A3FF9F|nr:mannitol dehydrogenase family protein [Kineosporia sp. NBRC 101677]GLY16433.1 mannitol dehydrogenase [Kineosporia sp. NBRC 101677]